MKLKNPTCGQRSDCPVNAFVEVIGDQWSLLLLRDMLLQNRARFSEFRQSHEGVATNILTSKLKHLMTHGLIEKHPDPSDGRGALYVATDRGLDVIPVLLAAMAWSQAHQPDTQEFGAVMDAYAQNPHETSAQLKDRARQFSKELLS